MLPIIICDDDNRYRNYLEEIIRKCIFIEELDMEVALSSDCAGKVLQYIKENQAPFLYFLDVVSSPSFITSLVGYFCLFS